jgi:RNA polymerase sigma-70 factor (ECF subfamily)
MAALHLAHGRLQSSSGGLLTDAEAIDRARRGDAAGLATLYHRHAAELFRLARRLLASSADAEDALHDLFVGLPELLERYQHSERLAPWLRGVLVRICLGRLRRDRERRRIVELREDLVEFRPHNETPWDAVDLERAISALSDAERAVFVLRQIEGYTHEEIGACLGISSGAARVRYIRAVRRLRKLLEPC